MRRYESKDGKRFWEVATSEVGLTIRTGSSGTDGKLSFKEMTLAEATALAEKRIASKEKAGFSLVFGGAGTEARNPGLEETICEDPTNGAGYHIYADWLQEQGEVRGELIALDVEPQTDAQGRKITKARKAFLKEHPHCDLPPRFGERAAKRRKKDQSPGTWCSATWRHGFVAAAEVGVDKAKPHTLRELVFELLAHPSARFLSSLRIGSLAKRGAYDYSDVADQIALIAPPALRELAIADFDEDSCLLMDSKIDTVAGLLANLPRLHRLELRAGSLDLAGLAHPKLGQLMVTVDELTADNLRAFELAELPALEALDINAGGAALPSTALAGLLANPPSGLRHLGLTHALDTEPVVRSLLDSPLGAQLTSLDLSFGTLSGGRDLLTAARLEGIETLAVSHNFLDATLEAPLREWVTTLAFDPQRENLAGYASVTEQEIRNFAPDGKSMTAARKLTKGNVWPRLGREPTVLWGECSGSSRYQVFVRIGEGNISDAACTCPSRKYPCKHALGLLLLAANGHRFPREAAPQALVSNAENARYESSWE